MLKKIIFTVLLITIAIPNISIAKSKYFFSFGFSELNMNGTGSYNRLTNIPQTGFLNTDSTIYGTEYEDSYQFLEEQSYDINLSESLLWTNNFQSVLSFNTGYQYSKSDIIVLNISFNIPKKGYRSSNVSSSILWKNSTGYPSDDSETSYSSFNYLQFSIHNEHLISNSLFIQLGLNFSKFSLESQNYYSLLNSYSGKTIGFSTGLGYVKSITESKEFIIRSVYSFNYHRNGNIDMDMYLNGISLGLEFRHFLITE